MVDGIEIGNDCTDETICQIFCHTDPKDFCIYVCTCAVHNRKFALWYKVFRISSPLELSLLLLLFYFTHIIHGYFTGAHLASHSPIEAILNTTGKYIAAGHRVSTNYAMYHNVGIDLRIGLACPFVNLKLIQIIATNVAESKSAFACQGFDD